MRWVAMKFAEGKMVIKAKMKWVGLMGIFLSVFSLFVHFLLARYTDHKTGVVSDYESSSSSVTIFAWRPLFKTSHLSITSGMYRRLWGPVPQFGSIYPHADPLGTYPAPSLQSTGFLFVRIQGGFHEIRTAICDAVVVARLLNATLVIPEILSTTSSKGISSDFKSFAYLYNEDQFMAALAKDVNIVKMLPKNLKEARRKKAIPMYRVPNSASPFFYLHQVLPMLKKHSVIELIVSDGGCLQAILPAYMEEYQRLRCRVAFHALSFRNEVQELATKILNRLRAPGRPFIAYDPGMTRDALAYYGCAKLFQDVHTELIQHKRSWMLKRGIVKGKLSVDSAQQRLNGSCPLMPEEVGIILRAYGYPSDTIIYVSGGEIFGGQRILIPLRSMFDNVLDRTSLTTPSELTSLYGRETDPLGPPPPGKPFSGEEVRKCVAWKNAGPRPRPLPPPPARPKTYNIEGWWGWVAESDNEPESTVVELRTNAHKLLWEAIDYMVCTEADVFISGFDLDGKGRPNFGSVVMGHRVYQSAGLVTYRPDRRDVVKLVDKVRDNPSQANRTWLSSLRKHLKKSLLSRLTEASLRSKPVSFLSHPVPECLCSREPHVATSRAGLTPSTNSSLARAFGVLHKCPGWMNDGSSPRVKDKENDEDNDEDLTSLSAFFSRGGGMSPEASGGETNGREDTPMEDQEELEGGDR